MRHDFKSGSQTLSETNTQLRQENRLRARVEAQLRDANRSKTRFMSATSHDLLQPINAARLFTSALKSQLEPGSQAQAVRNVVPALMNTVVSLQKDVALISVLGVRDATREAQIITSRTFNYTPFLVATVLFLLVSIPLTRYVDWYTARDRRLRSQAQV